MADTFAYGILKHIFLNENVKILIQISLEFVPRGSNDNKSVLVQVMAWRRTGNKPLPEQMMTQFTDAYMQHLAPLLSNRISVIHGSRIK